MQAIHTALAYVDWTKIFIGWGIVFCWQCIVTATNNLSARSGSRDGLQGVGSYYPEWSGICLELPEQGIDRSGATKPACDKPVREIIAPKIRPYRPPPRNARANRGRSR